MLWRIYGTVIIWICLNYVISKNILLICQKTSLQLPVDIFPYLNGGYAEQTMEAVWGSMIIQAIGIVGYFIARIRGKMSVFLYFEKLESVIFIGIIKNQI